MTFVQDKNGDILLTGFNDTLNNVVVSYEYGQKTLEGKIDWNNFGKCEISSDNSFKLKIKEDINVKDAYLYVKYTVNGETKTNLFSLDFWHSCKFENDYSIAINQEGNRATVNVKANKFAKSVFVCLPDNYKYVYSDNYIDVEAGEEKTITILSDETIDISKINISSFAEN